MATTTTDLRSRHDHAATAIHAPGRGGGPRRTKVLVAVRTPDHVEWLVRAGTALAREARAELLVLHVVRVPVQLPLSEAGRFRADARMVVQAVNRMGEHVLDVPVRLVLPAGRRVHEVILGAAAHHDVRGVVVGWPTRRGPFCPPGASVADRVLRGAPCQVMAVHPRSLGSHPTRVVLAVRPFNPRVHTVVTAVALARDHGAELSVMTALPHTLGRRAEIEARMWLSRLEGALTDAGAPPEGLSRTVLTTDRFPDALTDHLGPDDLVLIGAPAPGLLRLRSALRRLPHDLPRGVPGITVLDRPRTPTRFERLQQLLRRRPRDLDAGA